MLISSLNYNAREVDQNQPLVTLLDTNKNENLLLSTNFAQFGVELEKSRAKSQTKIDREKLQQSHLTDMSKLQDSTNDRVFQSLKQVEEQKTQLQDTLNHLNVKESQLQIVNNQLQLYKQQINELIGQNEELQIHVAKLKLQEPEQLRQELPPEFIEMMKKLEHLDQSGRKKDKQIRILTKELQRQTENQEQLKQQVNEKDARIVELERKLKEVVADRDELVEFVKMSGV